MKKEKLFEMLEDIQTQRPGWRFSLLGGDTKFGYKRDKQGKIKGVDKKKKQFFGWQAEFFGHEDPRKCTGKRIVSTQHYYTAEDAILVAIAEAKKAIKEGKE